ncbi:hypothetical protein BV22DRAFT_860702 [Leucogyrophana mollusca]|uniref:Uncharacterized protein n=1 Tax=Leucogyrophana mollusca TaxID=85980 RepID=A0ACB8B198_9AGAM|nr:hypothetical protein BV22DRAFT_860702 [Leucogyrophana mollusca]
MDGEEPQCDDGHASGIPINTDDDIPLQIPDFARAWDPSVRRPIHLPDPKEYHSVIDPRSIFELDLDSDSGIKKSILVVPRRCTFCARINQACSRLRPTCARCSKAGRKCAVVHPGWDNLPAPKRSISKAKSRFAPEPLTRKTPEGEPRSKSTIRLPARHIQPEQNPITKKLLRPKKSQANMARLGFTKTAKAKTLSELPFKKRRPKGATDATRIASRPQDTLQPKDGSDESPIAPSEPEWSFVKSSASKVEEQRRDAIRLPGSRPRVWVN